MCPRTKTLQQGKLPGSYDYCIVPDGAWAQFQNLAEGSSFMLKRISVSSGEAQVIEFLPPTR